MINRKIVHIDQEKCNGCGICIPSCHEGALKIVNGKAVLTEDKLCDGLGDCLGECPQGAITIIERTAEEYDEEAVKAQKAAQNMPIPCGCPGSMAKKLEKSRDNKDAKLIGSVNLEPQKSELNQWPVQLKLVSVHADYFDGADLLIAADCTAYAYGSFHKDFIKGRVTLIGCPKLDDNEFYAEKLSAIFKNNNIKSITVVRMQVPCCSGIVSAAKEAMLESKKIVPYREIVIGIDGEII